MQIHSSVLFSYWSSGNDLSSKKRTSNILKMEALSTQKLPSAHLGVKYKRALTARNPGLKVELTFPPQFGAKTLSR
jgi:hypothetical protein